ncbi:ribosomal protein S2, flavodoxin-like domain-containing protein [Calycina marina]|uniref:Ribosomal protein S2, flavodoxin-like domain-containing protein n=1 Tax=Calycina marina TaxID=1763456 RepID=A0A9P8CGT0_9HELO|nr:ribosomal protein S2, flavodoxin-like domain-containing protein [Calycina marina]
MILRNIAIRHGRRALAAPLPTSQLRSLSTETTTLPQQTDLLPPTFSNQSTLENSAESGPKQLRITQRLGQAKPYHRAKKDPQIKRDFQLKKTIERTTGKLGALVEPHYEPSQLLVDPPTPQDVTLELLMASQSHLGHATSQWNPANSRYIYGVRQGVHIISLEETAAHLRRAAKVVEGVAYHGGLILFVGTRKGQSACVVRAAEMAGGCHLFERWLPGTITNGDQILRRCRMKAIDQHDKELQGYDDKIENWQALKPDLVVNLNPIENYLLLHECSLNNIPTIGVIDTDANPTWVTYPIPANDDSLRCMQVIAGVLGRAGEAGQKRRLAAAESGEVTWLPPPNLGAPVSEAEKIKRNELKKEAILKKRKADHEAIEQSKVTAAQRELGDFDDF